MRIIHFPQKMRKNPSWFNSKIHVFSSLGESDSYYSNSALIWIRPWIFSSGFKQRLHKVLLCKISKKNIGKFVFSQDVYVLVHREVIFF